MPLPNGGGGAQIGDGNLNEVRFQPQPASADYTGAATLAVSDLAGGIVTYAGAGANLTLPTAAAMDAAINNATVNSAFDFSVVATGAGTATLVTNTGWTIVGRLTTATATASRYRARKTGVGTWTLYLLA